MMDRSDTSKPEYFHRVVDCQYACPAHTPVPEYIRLIARGEYTASYMLNRQSNVFPGILGRVCDRPCEPACRRARVDEAPVAICRLKRVAADNKDDIKAWLPVIPEQKNGKRIALIGSGPASLTVANDLMPLGYTCDLFEKDHISGGAMRSQVPAFRLPSEVLDEEIATIIDFGVNYKPGVAVTSLKDLLKESYDAIFLGTGAPRPRDLAIPGRKEAQHAIHLGLSFLADVSFGHRKTIGKRVVVVGGGNTAMDCCRTALRLGATEVTVVAPERYEQMLASPWEKEDAEHEGVKIHNDLLPHEFLCGSHTNSADQNTEKQHTLTGITFAPLKSCYNKDGRFDPIRFDQADKPLITLYCDDVIVAIGQDRAFPYIESDLPLWVDEQIWVDQVTMQTKIDRVFAGGDAAFGPKNIIWAVAHGHEAALSIHLFCQGKNPADRPPREQTLTSQKMALNQWTYDNNFDEHQRHQVPTQSLTQRFSDLDNEVELGFDRLLATAEVQRCLNCDVQTVFSDALCIECDACVDICPVACLLITPDASEVELRQTIEAQPSSPPQSLFVADVAQTDRVMIKDENICLHCGLCAERCPTGAWDMQQFDLKLPLAKDACS